MESFFTLISKQHSYKDNFITWTVMLCVNYHQKQVIHHKLLLDWRNLHMAWVMPVDGGGISLTRHCAVVVCCCVLNSMSSCKRTWNQGDYSQCKNKNKNNISIITEWSDRSRWCTDRMLDPIASSPATRKTVARIINLFVDDLFGTSGTEMEQRVLAKLIKEFQVGSEDWNDVTFTR